MFEYFVGWDDNIGGKTKVTECVRHISPSCFIFRVIQLNLKTKSCKLCVAVYFCFLCIHNQVLFCFSFEVCVNPLDLESLLS